MTIANKHYANENKIENKNKNKNENENENEDKYSAIRINNLKLNQDRMINRK